MEVLRIASLYRKKALARFTAKVSAGHLYEVAVRAHCRRRSYRILKKNWFVGNAEIDLLVEDPRGQLIVLEVRGRASTAFLPRHTLSAAKERRLVWLADKVARRYQRRIRVELVEVSGPLPQSVMGRILAWVFLRVWPEAFGICFEVVKL